MHMVWHACLGSQAIHLRCASQEIVKTGAPIAGMVSNQRGGYGCEAADREVAPAAFRSALKTAQCRTGATVCRRTSSGQPCT